MVCRFALTLVLAALPLSAGAAAAEPAPGAAASASRISPAAAKALVEKGAVLVDVREPAELEAEGWLPGAVKLPLSVLSANADASRRLPSGRTIIVYCKSGVRAAKAAAILAGEGYSPVYNLGGYSDSVPVFGSEHSPAR